MITTPNFPREFPVALVAFLCRRVGFGLTWAHETNIYEAKRYGEEGRIESAACKEREGIPEHDAQIEQDRDDIETQRQSG
jgi:hypothetical protein